MYEHVSGFLGTEEPPKGNLQFSSLRSIADAIESHGFELQGKMHSLCGEARLVEQLVAPFKTNTPADDSWSIDQAVLAKAVDAHLKERHKIDIMPPKQYKTSGTSDIARNKETLMLALKDNMTNPALTDEQRSNVDQAFAEVCPARGGVQR
jgi:hypothetical protein